MNKYIIDVSGHQGSIDFAKVKAAGVSGVMLKCTEGDGYLSPAFLQNYKNALAAPCGPSGSSPWRRAWLWGHTTFYGRGR